MHAACEMARPEIVKYLLDKDGKERLTAKNDAGFTPLVSAASKVDVHVDNSGLG